MKSLVVKLRGNILNLRDAADATSAEGPMSTFSDFRDNFSGVIRRVACSIIVSVTNFCRPVQDLGKRRDLGANSIWLS